MGTTEYYNYDDVTPTQLASTLPSNYYRCYSNVNIVTAESDKERIARIAKEKMYASWKMYNQKKENIIEVKQICKPRHKLNYGYRR